MSATTPHSVTDTPARDPITQPVGLTHREEQVMALIARGLANVEIAKVLQISQETVKSHVRHCLAKLPARNRAHAVGVWSGGQHHRPDLVNELLAEASKRWELQWLGKAA